MITNVHVIGKISPSSHSADLFIGYLKKVIERTAYFVFSIGVSLEVLY